MPTIILSYRREDTGSIAGRIFDRLVGHYGADQVFMDIDSIPFGLDFREHIQDTLDACDILLAIVGRDWAAPDRKGGFRINEETDWVRIEIEAALAKKIPVIPVLIDGTPLPPPTDLPDGLRNLAFRQAAPVDSGRDFHPHMDRLIKAMDRLLTVVPKPEEKKVLRTGNTGNPVDTKADLDTKKPDPKTDKKDDVSTPGKQGRTSLRQALLSAKGRMSRGTFCIIMIASYLAMYVAATGLMIVWFNLFGILGDANPAIILAIVWLWVPFAIGSKRLHDADKSGRWVFIPLAIGAVLALVFSSIGVAAGSNWKFIVAAGIIGLCVLFALGFLRGTPGPNRYGPDPLGRQSAASS